MKSSGSKKILLLQPPVLINEKGLGTGYSYADLKNLKPILPDNLMGIASFLERHGADVRVASLQSFFAARPASLFFYDGKDESLKRFAYYCRVFLDELFKQFYPDVLGIAVYTRDSYTTRVIINIVRKCYGGVKIVVGGRDPTFTAEMWLNDPYSPDAVVIGEGESTMREWVQKDFQFEGTIQGLAYKSHGAIINGGFSATLPESDFAPVNFELLLSPESIQPSDWSNMTSYSRGCPFDCQFCVNMSRKLRYKSLTFLEKELEFFSENGVKEIGFSDAIINVSRPHFRSLCDILSNFNNLKINAFCKIDLMKDEDMKPMKKSSIHRIFFGVESIVPEVLKAMGKLHYDEHDVRRVFQSVKEIGKEVDIGALIGHPGSTKELDMQTCDFVEELLEEGLLDVISRNIFVPFPGGSASMHPSVRIIEENRAEWTTLKPVHDLVGMCGNVVYSAEEMQEVYERYMALARRRSCAEAPSFARTA